VGRASVAKVHFSEREKQKLKEEIAAYYLETRDEEIGIIEQQQLLDLFTDILAPLAYDRALDDAKIWYQKQQENLDSDYFLLYRNQ